jgi:hypothetical protein
LAGQGQAKKKYAEISSLLLLLEQRRPLGKQLVVA